MSNGIVAIVGINDINFLKRFEKEKLRKKGFNTEYFRYADSAKEVFDNKMYNLITVNLDLEPRLNYKCESPNASDYGSVAFDVVRRARQSIINKETPIVIVSAVYPGLDDNRQITEKKSLEAGAQRYVSFFDDNWMEKIFEEIVNGREAVSKV